MNDATDIELPQALIDRLTEQDHAVTLITPQVDRAIVAAAQAQFAAREDILLTEHAAVSDPEQRSGYLSRVTHRIARATERASAWGLAAAAAAVVFVVVAVRDPALPGDFDGSGSVNVLDAFALSRELSQNPQFAANETVDSLMQRIVALDGGMR